MDAAVMSWEVQPDDWPWFEWIESAIECVVRSAALVAMVASFRLLAFAVPRKGGPNSADPWIGGARAMTKWAPLALIYVTCIPGVCGLTPADWSRIAVLDRNVQMAESVAREAVSVPLQRAVTPLPVMQWHMQHRGPDDPAEGVRPWFEDLELEQDPPAPLPRDPWHATASVYNFQAIPERVTLWVNPWESPEDIAQAVGHQLFSPNEDRFVHPLDPQPHRMIACTSFRLLHDCWEWDWFLLSLM